MAERVSPLKETPLRVPGQYIQGEIDHVRTGEIATFLTYAAAASALILSEWARWLLHAPPNPWLVTVVGGAAIGYSMHKIAKAKKKLRLLELGRDGERVVAEDLDELRRKGAFVLHDIVANGFNVDHVVIAKRGIYAIETKTWTKSPGAEITFDGTALTIGARKPPRDPLGQAVRNSDWLRETLKAITGKHYYVRPVVVFPGWYVHNPGGAERPGAWVLNPGQLTAIVADQAPSLTEEDVRAVVWALTQHVRTHPDAT